jgi:hypothetical protein
MAQFSKNQYAEMKTQFGRGAEEGGELLMRSIRDPRTLSMADVKEIATGVALLRHIKEAGRGSFFKIKPSGELTMKESMLLLNSPTLKNALLSTALNRTDGIDFTQSSDYKKCSKEEKALLQKIVKYWSPYENVKLMKEIVLKTGDQIDFSIGSINGKTISIKVGYMHSSQQDQPSSWARGTSLTPTAKFAVA